jgi:hypothetical protein
MAHEMTRAKKNKMEKKIRDLTRPRSVVTRRVSDLFRYRVEQQIFVLHGCGGWMYVARGQLDRCRYSTYIYVVSLYALFRARGNGFEGVE